MEELAVKDVDIMIVGDGGRFRKSWGLVREMDR